MPAILLSLLPAVIVEGTNSLLAYLTIGLTAFAGSELVALLAGFASEQGHLEFLPATLALSSGAWVVAVGLYFLGRWRAGWVRLKLRGAPPIVARIRVILRTNPWRSTILARFVFGGRILLPLACGAAHLPVAIFLAGTALASLVWALAWAGLGWFFGQSAVAIVGHVRRAEEVVAALVLVLAFTAVAVTVRRRQKQRP